MFIFLKLFFFFVFVFQVRRRIRSVSLSVSCPHLSSSSPCVVSTFKKRGKKKEHTSLPFQHRNLFKLRSLQMITSSKLLSAPSICSPLGPPPLWGLCGSSCHACQITLVWLLPAEDCVPASPKARMLLSVGDTKGSYPDQGPYECSLVSSSHISDILIKIHINGGPIW